MVICVGYVRIEKDASLAVANSITDKLAISRLKSSRLSRDRRQGIGARSVDRKRVSVAPDQRRMLGVLGSEGSFEGSFEVREF